MTKKAINLNEISFIQAINISAQWCKEWDEDLLSEEVLADRVEELIKTKNGLRGFFAYTLSDKDCYLLDKLPFPLVFKLTEIGENVVAIVVKNLIMSSAQVVTHDRNKNFEYKSASKNIAERCKGLLRLLETNLVTNTINEMNKNLDNLSNSFDKSEKYDVQQKEFIKKQFFDLAQ